MTPLEVALCWLCAVQGGLLIIAFLWIRVLRDGWVTTATFKFTPEPTEDGPDAASPPDTLLISEVLALRAELERLSAATRRTATASDVLSQEYLLAR